MFGSHALGAALLGGFLLLTAPAPGDVINTACPISKEAVDPSAPTVTFKGHEIGFCCGGCVAAFERWDDARKEKFVAAVLGASETPPGATTRPDEEAYEGDPYTLDVCPVSGEKLGSMGDPVVKVIDGREVRFCCAGCVGTFEGEKAKYFAEIDEKLIEQQKPYYPLTTCVVMPEDALIADGEDSAVDFVFGNRLFRLCCKGCKSDIREDPTRYTKALDEAVAKSQRDAYPIDICLVGGGKLGSMGEPVEIVVANRLVRFCCAGCIPTFKKDPAPYLARLDEAWRPILERRAKRP